MHYISKYGYNSFLHAYMKSNEIKKSFFYFWRERAIKSLNIFLFLDLEKKKNMNPNNNKIFHTKEEDYKCELKKK